MARSMPGFSVIGAQPMSSSALSGIVNLGSVVGDGRIEPGLKLATAAANEIGELGCFQVENRKQFRQAKFIEIKKRERAALRFRRRRNPKSKLGRIELRDLGGRARRDL